MNTGLAGENASTVQAGIEVARRNLLGVTLLLAAALSPLALATSNGWLTLAAVWTLASVVLLLFRFGEPPVLAFAIVLQWLSVASPIFTANIEHEVLGTSVGLSTMVSAAWLGLAALICLAFGIRVARGRSVPASIGALRRSGEQLIPLRLLVAYSSALAASLYVIPAAARLMPGFGQQITALASLPTLIAFLVLWSATVRPAGRLLAMAMVALNVAIGFGGYFSGFKEILLLAIVVISTNAESVRRLLANPVTLLLAASTLALVSFWSTIKTDYRDFANSGTSQQIVVVSPEARAEFLKRRLLEFKGSDLIKGLQLTLERVGYLTFFARVVESVPNRIPFQDGRMWGEAIQHVLLPRALFPQKASINDSDRTNEFTGIRVADAAEGASISIGYVGESYIDFGPIGMFVPIFLLGMLWGWGYRLLSTTGGVPLLSMATATIFILSAAHLFESSNIKIVGGALTLLLVLFLLLKFRLGELLWAFVTGQALSSAAASRDDLRSPISVEHIGR